VREQFTSVECFRSVLKKYLVIVAYGDILLRDSYCLNALEQKGRGMFKFKTTGKVNLVSSK
jgi:glyoxylate utilization-related uncharacterized protein